MRNEQKCDSDVRLVQKSVTCYIPARHSPQRNNVNIFGKNVRYIWSAWLNRRYLPFTSGKVNLFIFSQGYIFSAFYFENFLIEKSVNVDWKRWNFRDYHREILTWGIISHVELVKLRIEQNLGNSWESRNEIAA